MLPRRVEGFEVPSMQHVVSINSPESFEPINGEISSFPADLVASGGNLFASDYVIPMPDDFAEPEPGADYRRGAVYCFSPDGTLISTTRHPRPETNGVYGLRLFASEASVLAWAWRYPPNNSVAPVTSLTWLRGKTGKMGKSFEGTSTPSSRLGEITASDGKSVFIGVHYGNSRGFACYTKAGKFRYEVTTPTTFLENSQLGCSISIGDGELFVGASEETTTGRVHVYEPKKGTLLRTIENPDPVNVSEFGSKVMATETHVAVRGLRRLSDEPGMVSGAIFIYERH